MKQDSLALHKLFNACVEYYGVEAPVGQRVRYARLL